MVQKKALRLLFRDVLVIVLAAVVASVLIKTYLVRSFYIPSASMESTLLINDRVVVNELQPSVFPLSRGDVVVFRDPGGWLHGGSKGSAATSPIEAILSFVGIPSGKEDGYLIKRVIGLPGDTVTCCDAHGRMSVNGMALNEASYLRSPDQPASAMRFTVTVPPRSLWVMGDNRNNSGDSRFHLSEPGRGAVPVSTVVGRALAVTWPVGRWTWLDPHPTVFARVPAPPGR